MCRRLSTREYGALVVEQATSWFIQDNAERFAALDRQYPRDLFDVNTHNFLGMTTDAVSLDELLDARYRLMREIQRGLDDDEQQFLLSVVRADPDWSLLKISHLEQLPAIRWKLHNLIKLKQINIKKFSEQADLLVENLASIG